MKLVHINNLFHKSPNHSQPESGQALVVGLIFFTIVLFFSALFLFTSESILRMYSNAEEANAEVVKNLQKYAHILNEVSINNQNIIAAITVSQNALLKSMEQSLYLSFNQPYWITYSTIRKGNDRVSEDTKKLIERAFSSYSLNSSRGFFIAKALSEKNKILLSKLPIEMSSFFIQSSNSEVNCFALNAQKKYYNSPGILKLPLLQKFIYRFYLHINDKNKCKIEHKLSAFHQILEPRLPLFYTNTKDDVFDYSIKKFDENNNYNYGISYIDPKLKYEFLQSLNFSSPSKIKIYEKSFSTIAKYLSKIPYFKHLDLDNKDSFLKSSIINQFKIIHGLLYGEMGIEKKELDDEDFIKMFFNSNWTVTGVFK
jgi:hypothetical protein